MAKYIKSFFQTEKRSHSYEGSDEERSDIPPPMEGRRKLSVSRSGRMRQAQKKRLSLSMDIYGDDPLQTPEKPKSMEYHVSSISTSAKGSNVPNPYQGRPSVDSRTSSESNRSATSANDPASAKHDPKQRKIYSINTELKKKTPEEEIDIAFEVIDKTIVS